MMSIKRKLKHFCFLVGSILLISQAASANTNLAFHDVSSTVMMNSLEMQPKDSFLRQLYTQLFFVPVWVQEESLTPLSK